MSLHSLQAKLAQSLDSANSRKENTAPRPKTTHAAPRPTQAKGGKYLRLCISLTPSDQERIDAICSYLGARGHRITTSRAVKLALRTAPISAAMTAALDEIKAEDGRRA